MAQINSAGKNIRYESPQVKVLVFKSRHVLCQSPFGEPGVDDYNEGSSSHFGFGGDDDE